MNVRLQRIIEDQHDADLHDSKSGADSDGGDTAVSTGVSSAGSPWDHKGSYDTSRKSVDCQTDFSDSSSSCKVVRLEAQLKHFRDREAERTRVLIEGEESILRLEAQIGQLHSEIQDKNDELQKLTDLVEHAQKSLKDKEGELSRATFGKEVAEAQAEACMLRLQEAYKTIANDETIRLASLRETEGRSNAEMPQSDSGLFKSLRKLSKDEVDKSSVCSVQSGHSAFIQAEDLQTTIGSVASSKGASLLYSTTSCPKPLALGTASNANDASESVTSSVFPQNTNSAVCSPGPPKSKEHSAQGELQPRVHQLPGPGSPFTPLTECRNLLSAGLGGPASGAGSLQLGMGGGLQRSHSGSLPLAQSGTASVQTSPPHSSPASVQMSAQKIEPVQFQSSQTLRHSQFRPPSGPSVQAEYRTAQVRAASQGPRGVVVDQVSAASGQPRAMPKPAGAPNGVHAGAPPMQVQHHPAHVRRPPMAGPCGYTQIVSKSPPTAPRNSLQRPVR